MGSVLGRDWGYRGNRGAWVGGSGGNGGHWVGGSGGNCGFRAAGAEGARHGDLFWFEWGDARVRT